MMRAAELALLSLTEIGEAVLAGNVERDIAAGVLLERAIRKAEKKAKVP